MAGRLQDVILRGLSADRPLATTVAPGTLYFNTDLQTTDRCADDGLTWETYTDGGGGTPPTFVSSIVMMIDGGGSVITTGVKGYVEIPFSCTILSVTLLADLTGSVVVDIWKDVYGSYPPVAGDSITAAAKPTITASNKSKDTTLVGWTTAIAAGDILGFNVSSISTITKLTLNLKVQVP